jgi:hypothetical protein
MRMLIMQGVELIGKVPLVCAVFLALPWFVGLLGSKRVSLTPPQKPST